MYWFEATFSAFNHKGVRLSALLWAGLCYLLEPDAAFLAVWIAVLVDLLTRLVAIAAQNHGFIRAVKGGHISSKKAFLGSFVKLVAYFSLGVIATQAQYVAYLEVAAVMTKTVIYAFLFTVEVISIMENLLDMGLSGLKPLLVAVKKYHATDEND